MNKSKLKKLALMGITGGVILSNQGLKADETSLLDENQALSNPSWTSQNHGLRRRNGCGGGCGGKHGCGGGSQDQWMNQGNNNGNQERDNGNQQRDNDQRMYPSNQNGQRNAMQRGGGDYEPESEAEFTQQLGPEGRRLYNSLSEEGKQLARRLAKQYADKTQAVRHAARQIQQQNQGAGSPMNSNQRYNLMR